MEKHRRPAADFLTIDPSSTFMAATSSRNFEDLPENFLDSASPGAIASAQYLQGHGHSGSPQLAALAPMSIPNDAGSAYAAHHAYMHLKDDGIPTIRHGSPLEKTNFGNGPAGLLSPLHLDGAAASVRRAAGSGSAASTRFVTTPAGSNSEVYIKEEVVDPSLDGHLLMNPQAGGHPNELDRDAATPPAVSNVELASTMINSMLGDQALPPSPPTSSTASSPSDSRAALTTVIAVHPSVPITSPSVLPAIHGSFPGATPRSGPRPLLPQRGVDSNAILAAHFAALSRMERQIFATAIAAPEPLQYLQLGEMPKDPPIKQDGEPMDLNEALHGIRRNGVTGSGSVDAVDAGGIYRGYNTGAPATSRPAKRVYSTNDVNDPLNAEIDDDIYIDTKDLCKRIAYELKQHSIPQAIFAERILCRSQGTLSDLLRNPKPWNKLKSGRETFRRMFNWVQQPLALRLGILDMYKDGEKPNGGSIGVTAHIATLGPGGMSPPTPAQNVRHHRRSTGGETGPDGQPLNKRPRLVFTDIQKRTLQAIFRETQRPSREMQQTIAEHLRLDLSTVANFFMNARRRSRLQGEDEPAPYQQVNRITPPPPSPTGGIPTSTTTPSRVRRPPTASSTSVDEAILAYSRATNAGVIMTGRSVDEDYALNDDVPIKEEEEDLDDDLDDVDDDGAVSVNGGDPDDDLDDEPAAVPGKGRPSPPEPSASATEMPKEEGAQQTNGTR